MVFSFQFLPTGKVKAVMLEFKGVGIGIWFIIKHYNGLLSDLLMLLKYK